MAVRFTVEGALWSALEGEGGFVPELVAAVPRSLDKLGMRDGGRDEGRRSG